MQNRELLCLQIVLSSEFVRASMGSNIPRMIQRFSHAPNKQLQRTVIGRRERAASASFHYALAARSNPQRAAAELRR